MGLGQRLGPRLRRQPLACESTGTIQALPCILMRSLKTCGAKHGLLLGHDAARGTCGTPEAGTRAAARTNCPERGGGEGGRAALRLRYVQHAGGRHAHVQHSLLRVST